MHNTIRNNSSPRIAFFGMGLMGSRMSKRLLHAGFDVSVWNRTPNACQALYSLGANALDITTDIANVDVLMLCLADDQAVDAVVQQFFEQLQPQQIIVDFSSLSVDATKQLAARVNTKGAHWVDAPVSGGVMGAEQGNLVVFAGGDAEVIASLDAVFTPLAQRVTHMGATGTGQASKICNQLIVAASSTLIAEAISLAERAGVDSSLLAPALAGGFADSKPLQILAPRMASKTFTPVQWKVQTLSKDLHNAMTLAAAHQLAIPVAERALAQLQQHQANGHTEDDLSSLILLHPSAIKP